MNLTCYEQEIAPKGKAYLGLAAGPTDGLRETCAVLRQKGARQIFLAFKDREMPPEGGSLDGLGLTYSHDMLGMTCPLDPAQPRSKGLITLEPLTRENKEPFLRIYHESFFAVPNSSTYGDEAFEQIMGPQYRCGFALVEGAPAGIYELGFKKEHPEIGSIGLEASYLGRGLGRELLLTVMDYLAGLGHTACWLQVATANENAYGLYRSVGFVETERLSRWYEVWDG